MVTESAQNAAERLLVGTVLLVDVATLWARPAGVPRVYSDDPDTCEDCLVLDFGAQLTERPAGMPCPLTPPNGCPIANALEVFEGDTTSGAFGFGHDVLADAVVLDGAEAGLLAREFLQVTLGRFGARLLERLPERVVTNADNFYLSTRVALSVGISGDVSDTEVDAEEAFRVDGRSVRYVNGHVQEQFPVATDQVSLTPDALDTSTVVRSHHNGDDKASVEAGDTDAVKAMFECVCTLIESNGPVWTELRKFALVPLVDFTDLRDSSNGVLCTERERLSDFPVEEFLEPKFVRCLKLESLCGEPVTSRVYPLHGGEETALLGFIHNEFHGGYEFHSHRHNTSKKECKVDAMMSRPLGRFLPHLKEGASAALLKKSEAK